MTKFEYPRLWPFVVLGVLVGGLWISTLKVKRDPVVFHHAMLVERRFSKYMEYPRCLILPSGRVWWATETPYRSWRDYERHWSLEALGWKVKLIPIRLGE